MNSQTVTVNLIPGLSTPAVVRVSQYDVGRPLAFKVLDGTNVASLGAMVTTTIVGTKPSGLGFSVVGTLYGNIVTLDTTLAMTQECGMIPAEIRFTTSTPATVIGTANFILAVEPSPHPEGTTDGTYETMGDLQSQLNALDTRVDALEAGGGGSGLTDDVKTALLQIAQKVAYIDANGQNYYDDLYDALYSSTTRSVLLVLSHVSSSNTQSTVEAGDSYSTTLTASTNYTINSVTVTMGGVDVTSTTYSSGTVSIPSVTGNIVITATAVLAAQSITATYTQSGAVYDTDTLDSLKPDLVVTANYSGGTSETVPASDYTLSGTLTVGTSTITVSYAGLTDTFSVTVSTYITNGLIHHWDAIDNTGNGHDSTATTWADLVGTNDFNFNGSQIAWGTNYLSFPGVTGNYLSSLEDAEHSGGKTVEVCFKPDNAQSTVVCCAFNNEGADTSTSNAFGKIVIYSDNSVNAKGQSSSAYPTGLTALTDVNGISASYSADTTISAVYVNGVAKTASGSSHSMRGSSKKVTAGASPTNYDYAFKGKIYDIRIYNRVLTASEVAENYQVDLERFGLE